MSICLRRREFIAALGGATDADSASIRIALGRRRENNPRKQDARRGELRGPDGQGFIKPPEWRHWNSSAEFLIANRVALWLAISSPIR